jgi:hypothetical protein
MAGNRTVRTDTLAETHAGVKLTMPGRHSLVQPKSLVTRSVLKRVDLHEYLPNIYIVYTIYMLIYLFTYVCIHIHMIVCKTPLGSCLPVKLLNC